MPFPRSGRISALGCSFYKQTCHALPQRWLHLSLGKGGPCLFRPSPMLRIGRSPSVNSPNCLSAAFSLALILPGLSLVVGLVLYISSINDEVMNRPSGSEQYFHYRYGWSFAFAASSFLLKEGAGVMSVYLFTKRYAEEEMYRPHPAFYRPRLSDCSDYSGQFLHPEVWHRGRSPSDISSDVSIQMTQNYPPAIKYPEHMHISTSPC
uniref:Calcium voltage-gated channel auxiliary subunit gamma 7 n=1 Tax=Pelodiscus sinensis TaxID=13735 RepID=K7GAT0_PELSI